MQSVVLSVDYPHGRPRPVALEAGAGLEKAERAFAGLTAHFCLSALVPRGGTGYTVTFRYADGGSDTYRLFGDTLRRNGSAVPLTLDEEDWSRIYNLMRTHYFHGMSWPEWTDWADTQPEG